MKTYRGWFFHSKPSLVFAMSQILIVRLAPMWIPSLSLDFLVPFMEKRIDSAVRNAFAYSPKRNLINMGMNYRKRHALKRVFLFWNQNGF